MNRTAFPASLLALAILVGVTAPASAQEAPVLEIEVGQTVEGRLTGDGPSLLEGETFVSYRFRAEAGKRYVADARSDDFDTYLVLARAVAGITEFLREDDDGGDGTNARLRFSIDRPGDYLLIVRGWQAGHVGRFSLSLAEREIAPPTPPRPIVPGRAVSGQLTDGSSVFITEWDDEIPYDLWRFEGRGGEHYLISMESTDFDAYLDFGPLSGDDLVVEHSDDDGGEGTDALLMVRLPHDGAFGIRARPFSGSSDLGAYRLSVEPFTPRPAARRPIGAGEIVTAELGVDDAVLEGGSHFQEWTFTGRADQTVRIRMRSDDFDSYLSLGRHPSGQEYIELAYNDDAPDDGLNSLIEFRLPADGEYVIRARSFGSGSRGSYTLELQIEG